MPNIGFALGLIAALATMPVAAQDHGTFDPLVIDDHSVEGTASIGPDPTSSGYQSAFSFRLPAGTCGNVPYEPGTDDSDCKYNSARSQVREDVFKTRKNGHAQPEESWYTWAIYFPETAAIGIDQTKGSFEFAYWHNHQCPHLTFMNWAGEEETLRLLTNKSLGGYECAPNQSVAVVHFSELRGKWSRFEVFVRWSKDDTGSALVFIDGMRRAEFSGPTLIEGLEDINYFKFGLYLCCTGDFAKIKEASAYYASVKRADRREDLFTQDDRSDVLRLQEALNGLGCNVGKPDGVVGRRTREQAVSCRRFPEMPSELTAGSLRRFVELYSTD